MLNDSDYVRAYSHETLIDGARLGVRIYIATNHQPTESEQEVAWDIGEKMFNEIWRQTVLQDETSNANVAKEKEDILRLFMGKSIFVEEIPNGYCNQPCCCNKPWFIVTTPIGHIKIGWRKRVINIDWTRTLQNKHGQELFPNEDVTKSSGFDKERFIHAWGYEKAKEYLDVIHLRS